MTTRADAEKPARKPDPERTKQDILAVARAEFVEHGLSGARVDAIAARTRTTKRMIYYYFGSKEGLYLAVLEQAYADIRAIEQTLDLKSLPPAQAIRRMVEFTFDYQESHPDFIRLVSIENIHHGKHLARSDSIRQLNEAVIEVVTEILDRGKREGVFCAEVDPVDVHMLISAFCFFRVSNRYTFGLLFGRDLSSAALRARHKRMIADAVIRLLAPDPAGPEAGPTARAPMRRSRSAASPGP
ncbi:TetR family transcriptional regulator [Limobrevibacterium gyesilva]|uniref:TetR family transcriptional regulator n=1 Tax=Limobrevibacterium gyesilva TaxID=2991712 RepID=A0AA41YLB4_9PROT|nr:TetR family transcriptional regulator [Limobrevibacterium gyesilva]MCW3474506.1 TetR family transcriptional regulator [Limobrevibacterium gyesilva]